jgi:hypothetical protein
MWMQIAWRSDLPLVECEERLGKMPRRSFLVSRSGSPVVVARPSGRLFRLFVAGGPTRVLLAPSSTGSSSTNTARRKSAAACSHRPSHRQRWFSVYSCWCC